MEKNDNINKKIEEYLSNNSSIDGISNLKMMAMEIKQMVAERNDLGVSTEEYVLMKQVEDLKNHVIDIKEFAIKIQKYEQAAKLRDIENKINELFK